MHRYDCARWLAVVAMTCGPSVACAQVPQGGSPAESAITPATGYTPSAPPVKLYSTVFLPFVFSLNTVP